MVNECATERSPPCRITPSPRIGLSISVHVYIMLYNALVLLKIMDNTKTNKQEVIKIFGGWNKIQKLMMVFLVLGTRG